MVYETHKNILSLFAYTIAQTYICSFTLVWEGQILLLLGRLMLKFLEYFLYIPRYCEVHLLVDIVPI